MWDNLIQALALPSLGHFHFLRPWWGLLLFLFLIPITHLYRSQRMDKKWGVIFAPHILDALLLKDNKRRLLNPLTLYSFLVVLFLLVIMGPTWVQQPSPFSKDEAGMVVVLDVSNSMLSADVQPSRLERAKHKIRDLLVLRDGSKTGLVVFAGSAHTVLPLTDDGSLIEAYLGSLQPAIMPREGKFPEQALPLVQQQLGRLSVPGSVLLITDGLSDATEKAFAEYFATNPHQLLVLGVGDASGAHRDKVPATPILDESGLQRLASAAGGNYISLSLDDGDVKKINRRADNYFVPVENKNIPWRDVGYYLLFLLIPLYAVWFRKGVSLQWAVVLCLSLVGFSAPQPVYADETNASLKQTFLNWWMTPDQQGAWHFQRGEYLAAAADFEALAWKATSYYLAEEFVLAAEYFSRIDSEKGLFNVANALAHGQHYVAAVKRYQRILRQNPAHTRAEKNRAVVQALIDAINAMSESQVDEPGSLDSSKELAADEPRRAEGAEKQAVDDGALQQLTAEELLQNKSINDMWLRSVQQDPSDFLASKFHLQLEGEQE